MNKRHPVTRTPRFLVFIQLSQKKQNKKMKLKKQTNLLLIWKQSKAIQDLNSHWKLRP